MQRISTHRNATCWLLFVCIALLLPSYTSARPRFAIKDWVTGLAYSPDGKFIAVGGLNAQKAYLLDAATWKVLHVLQHRYEGGTELTFSPSGEVLASVANGLDEVAVYFWNVSTGSLISTFAEHDLLERSGHRKGISAVSFSPDGKLLAIGINDGVVRLINVENPSAPRTLNERLVTLDTGISTLNFSPDSSRLAVSTGKGVTAPRDFGILKVVETETGHDVTTFSKLGFVYDSSYSAQGDLLAIAVNKGVILIDTRSWTTRETVSSFTPSKIALSKTAQLLAVGGAYGGLQIWDVAHTKLIRSIDLKSVSALTLSPDDKFVLVGSEDGRIRVYPLPQ
jgi:WD40 repeat protein